MKASKTFIASLALAASLSATGAQANPVNKLCRSSTQVQAMYADYLAEKPAKIKGLCFHAGRLTGAIEDGMTFRDRAREKTPPDLLAMADQMVAHAAELARDCKDDSDDAQAAMLTEKIFQLVGPGSTNELINAKACGAE
jgi:hypothetical protein